MHELVLVLAETRQQAERWARNNELAPSRWRHIGRLDSERHLRGRRGGVVYVLPGAPFDRVSQELLHMARHLAMDIRYVADDRPTSG